MDIIYHKGSSYQTLKEVAARCMGVTDWIMHSAVAGSYHSMSTLTELNIIVPVYSLQFVGGRIIIQLLVLLAPLLF